MTRTEPNVVGSYLLYLAGRYAASQTDTSRRPAIRKSGGHVVPPTFTNGWATRSVCLCRHVPPGPIVPAPLVTAKLLVSFTIHQHSGVGCLLGFRFVCGWLTLLICLWTRYLLQVTNYRDFMLWSKDRKNSKKIALFNFIALVILHTYCYFSLNFRLENVNQSVKNC